MDFTHTAYFAGAQPYPFMGMPPLTPHTASVASDDFTTRSPPVGSNGSMLGFLYFLVLSRSDFY